MMRYLFVGFLLCQGCSRGGDNAVHPDQPRQQSADSEQTDEPAAEGKNTAALQPRWTMIEGVRACTGTILSSYVCAPPQRPADCSEQAWQELSALSGKEALTPCALEPDILDCSTSIPDDEDGRCFPAVHPATCPDDKWARVKDVKLVFACNTNQ